MGKKDKSSNQLFHCSFCNKSQREVRKLIAGPSVYICDECIALCNDVIHEELSGITAIEQDRKFPTPCEINEILNDYVIGQEQAKKTLSVAVYNHYKRIHHSKSDDDIELSKSNVLLIGPTGSGKTLLAETLARLLNVPFTIADATTLTEAGYVGEDVENILQRLLQKCDYNIEKAEVGIIYIDEVDKISRKSDSPSITRDVSGEGVQQALLKLIEGTVASVPLHGGRKHPQQECLRINTANILFICGGAFGGLDKITKQRITTKGGIGFLAEVKSKDDNKMIGDILRQIETEDLLTYGLIPELVGRLPIFATLDELNEQELVRVLTEPKNALIKQYKQLFKMDGCDLEFREDALNAIAHKATERKTGARGLRSILEGVLLHTMYELPSKPEVTKIIVDESVIKFQSNPLSLYESGKQRRIAADG